MQIIVLVIAIGKWVESKLFNYSIITVNTMLFGI